MHTPSPPHRGSSTHAPSPQHRGSSTHAPLHTSVSLEGLHTHPHTSHPHRGRSTPPHTLTEEGVHPPHPSHPHRGRSTPPSHPHRGRSTPPLTPSQGKQHAHPQCLWRQASLHNPPHLAVEGGVALASGVWSTEEESSRSGVTECPCRARVIAVVSTSVQHCISGGGGGGGGGYRCEGVRECRCEGVRGCRCEGIRV